MDKEAIKNFISWLEEASDEEIERHQSFVEAQAGRVSSREGLADVRLALRLIDEEVLSRMKAPIDRKA